MSRKLLDPEDLFWSIRHLLALCHRKPHIGIVWGESFYRKQPS